MLCLAVELKNAEKAKQFLLQHALYGRGHNLKRYGKTILLPLEKKLTKKEEKELGAEFEYCNAVLEPSPLGQGLKEKLKDAGVSRSELERMVFSFDVVGDVAVIEVPEEFEDRKKQIGETLLKMHRNLKTVLCKKSAMKGRFRVRELEWVAGEKKTKTEHRESGVRMRLDLATCFFSPRLGTERMRIAGQVNAGEKVLVLFAGVGPFALVIAKKQPGAEVVGVELNPEAVKYFEENIELNKLQNVHAILGDANVVAPSLFNSWADRIVMPLPHTAHEFLDAALAAAKPGAIVHYYGFERVGKNKEEKEKIRKKERIVVPNSSVLAGVCGQATRAAIVVPNFGQKRIGRKAEEKYFIIGGEGKVLVAPVEELVKRACEKNKRKCKILLKKTMRSYAPGVEQRVVDFLVV